MDVGFFDLGTGEIPVPGKKFRSVKTGCELCGLSDGCKNPKMAIQGEGKKGILIIGDMPGKHDDANGTLFSGEAGTILRKTLYTHDIDIYRDCFLTNAILCRSDKEAPTDREIDCCRRNIIDVLNTRKPRVVIPLGADAVQSIIGDIVSGRLSSTANNKYFGERIPLYRYNTWVCPTYHPLYLLKNEDDTILQKQFSAHIKNAIRSLREDMATENKPDIQILKRESEAIEVLKSIESGDLAFDYETTGIKPHKEGHRIVCIAISNNPDTGYAFPAFKSEEFRNEWKRIMLSEDIRKIAHKADFEMAWTRFYFGYYPENIFWDTCIGAHCIHNEKPTGLKFHTFVNFGEIGYDDSVDKFLSSKLDGEEKKSGNSFNRIDEADIDELLKYNGLDTVYTYRLYQIQKAYFQEEENLYKGFLFFMKGVEALGRVQGNGMRVDMERFKVSWDKITSNIESAEESLRSFDEYYKWSGNTALNVNSSTQMSKLLYEILGYKKPETGSKTDEDALEKIGTPFVSAVLTYRRQKKIRDTYLSQFQREQVDGIVRPFFNLHLVSTFRSSSDSPNFQNIPKRDKEAQKAIRTLIRPSPGNRLIEYDYKGVEVSVGACYHKDPTMVEYILDPKTDMHRDMAVDLFFRGEKDVSKEERQIAKNGFVFPAFYGSTTKNIAPNIWNMLPDSTKSYIAKFGIKDFQKFEKHVFGIEQKFWGERFEGYRDWKRKTYKQYEKDGHLDLYTGFRCHGPLSFTEATNYQIQGSAFHCLLWTLSRVSEKIVSLSKNHRSSIIGQIHDAIVVDAHPDDEKEIDSLMYEYGTQRIRKYWKWIIVPLTIEKERSAVDGDWSNMESQGKLEEVV